MLFAQIIEFEVKKPGPPGCRTCTPITAYFKCKTKISEEYFRVEYYLLLKYCRRQCALLPSTWAKSLKKFNTQVQDFKCVFVIKLQVRENWTI